MQTNKAVRVAVGVTWAAFALGTLGTVAAAEIHNTRAQHTAPNVPVKSTTSVPVTVNTAKTTVPTKTPMNTVDLAKTRTDFCKAVAQPVVQYNFSATVGAVQTADDSAKLTLDLIPLVDSIHTEAAAAGLVSQDISKIKRSADLASTVSQAALTLQTDLARVSITGLKTYTLTELPAFWAVNNKIGPDFAALSAACGL